MIVVTPGSFSILSNTTFNYMAMGMYADNTMEELSADVTWASSNGSVATVSNSTEFPGLVTGVTPGTSLITASLDGMTGSTTITVMAPSPPPITVTAVHPQQNKQHLVTRITIDLSGPVDAAEANDVATYSLMRSGKKGSFDARYARVIKVRSAVYDAALHEVILTARKPFSLSKPVRLSIDLKTGDQVKAGIKATEVLIDRP
jgi:hypothetical protein